MAMWSRLRWWLSSSRRDRDIAEEMQKHLEMAADRHRSEGIDAAEARRRAEREFGNLAQVRQHTREVWTWTWLEQLVQDLRFGARILWKAPAVSLTAVTLIALVIGGETTPYPNVPLLLTSPAPGGMSQR